MTLKPAPVQLPFKPSRSPNGLSAVWTEENRSGLSIAGSGVKAKSGLSSISPLRSPVVRTINLHYRGQLARARGQRRGDPTPVWCYFLWLPPPAAPKGRLEALTTLMQLLPSPIDRRVTQPHSSIEVFGDAGVVLQQGAGVDLGELDRAHRREGLLNLRAPQADILHGRDDAAEDPAAKDLHRLGLIADPAALLERQAGPP